MRLQAALLTLAVVALAPACSDYDPADEALTERSAPAIPDAGEAYGPCLADGTCDEALACVELDGASFCAPPCIRREQCQAEINTDHVPIGHVLECVAGFCEIACKEAENWCLDDQACLSVGGRGVCAWPGS